jgi:cytochrome c2
VSKLTISIRWLLCGALLSASTPAHAIDPATIFGMKCSSCHTYGHGEKVGPDLKGVADRRSRTWLAAWIRSSERTIKSGDPVATTLFKKYKQERMPDQNFSPAEIAALIDYLAAGGPDAADRSRPRQAGTATAQDVALGRRLFLGTVSASRGGASCASCHRIREEGAAVQATFGADLTHVYSRFQDAALSTFLERPCFPRVGVPLTANESFAMRAFLRYVDGKNASASAPKEPR